MWELPTPLIVANRSQQGDEVYGSYPLVLEHASCILSYNYYKEIPSNTDLTPNELPERQTKSDAYANKLQKGDVLANLSSLTQASKVVPNEAPQQVESSATTITSVEAVYHRQSKKIRFGEQ
ncbi:hypothetical protein F511_40337 [Dorcoceras hygrometricum]|uniref:Uncharacterized protein n=1 Tax=Dorcoceras hygrometricum TaxID=472368 RepID=A0A2Z7AW53_9LAMI|nr:hypothetical protein F511_40337 [Dorcoceras hygrometricum]